MTINGAGSDSAGQAGVRRHSRRSTLRYAAGAAVGTTATALLSPFGGQAQTPRKGGIARIATEITDATATLDPSLIFTNTDIARGFQIYNGLVRIDEKLAVQPSLAETWEPAKPDGTEWVFKLRRGVEFHDGKPLTAADVVWNMQRHLGAKSESRARNLMAAVEERARRRSADRSLRPLDSAGRIPGHPLLPAARDRAAGHQNFSRPSAPARSA